MGFKIPRWSWWRKALYRTAMAAHSISQTCDIPLFVSRGWMGWALLYSRAAFRTGIAFSHPNFKWVYGPAPFQCWIVSWTAKCLKWKTKSHGCHCVRCCLPDDAPCLWRGAATGTGWASLKMGAWWRLKFGKWMGDFRCTASKVVCSLRTALSQTSFWS